jgi:hypothetical protein
VGFGRTERIALILIVCAIGCSACTASSGDAGSGPTPARTTPGASPTIVDEAPCPLAPGDLGLPPGAGCASSATGTFETGEGLQSLIVYADLDARRFPVAWRVRVTRDADDPLDERLGYGSEFSYPEVLGAENADDIGPDEAFVKVLTHSFHSGRTHEVAILGVRDGHVFTVEADGEPLVFQVGGVSYSGWGAECRDVDLDGSPEFLVLSIDGVFGEIQK